MSRRWVWLLVVVLCWPLRAGAQNPAPGQLLYTPVLKRPKWGINYPASQYPPLGFSKRQRRASLSRTNLLRQRLTKMYQIHSAT